MRFFVVLTIGICMSMPLAVSATEEPAAITISIDTSASIVTDPCADLSDELTTSQATLDGKDQETESQEEDQADTDCSDSQPQSVSWNS